jgi:hypothetical protein
MIAGRFGTLRCCGLVIITHDAGLDTETQHERRRDSPDTLEKAHLLATNDEGEFELRKNRNVLRCADSTCRTNVWNRDVNAARNILELLATRLMGLGRNATFARG